MQIIDQKLSILIRMSLKHVPNDLVNNNISSVQIMAWRRGDKPSSEAMKASVDGAYMRHLVSMG